VRRDQLHIAEPCNADWTAMSGDERERFCGSCQKHVHDLSAMSARQAEQLVRGQEGLCVRYRVDRQGRLVHRRNRLLGAVAAGLALSAPALASGAIERDTSWFDRLVDWATSALTEEAVTGQVVAPRLELGEVELMGDVVFEPEAQPTELSGEPEAAVMGRVRAID